MASNKEVMELFMTWVKEHPELDGVPILFACCDEDGSSATVQGGQDIKHPAFDEMVMRTAYQIGLRRSDDYISTTYEETISREVGDGSVTH